MENAHIVSGGLQFKGIWHVELFENGVKVLDHVQDNIIVDNAIVHMAHGYGPAHFQKLRIGTAPFPSQPNVGQTDLDAPISPDFVTVHTAANSPGVFSFQKKASLALTDAVGTLTEAGLVCADGVLFNRILFSPSITKTNTQTAFITTTIQIRRV